MTLDEYEQAYVWRGSIVRIYAGPKPAQDDPPAVHWCTVIADPRAKGSAALTWAGEAAGMFRVETVRSYLTAFGKPLPWWVRVFEEVRDYEP